MRLLITNCHLSFPHGSEVFTQTIAEEFKRRGDDVYIWSPEYGMFWANYIQGKFKTIRNHEQTLGFRFDLAILQHLAQIRNDLFFQHSILPMITQSKIIAMTHGTYVGPEMPVEDLNLNAPQYTCISPEIAQFEPFKHLSWNLIKQPIAPEWFKIPHVGMSELPEMVLWASHRHSLPDSLRLACKELDIPLNHIGFKLTLPEAVYDAYKEADLVLGTGRWIYQAMAAGIPCIVADAKKQLGYVNTINAESYEWSNMTCRHRNAVDHDFKYLINHYKSHLGKNVRDYALSHHHVSTVVDSMLRIVDL